MYRTSRRARARFVAPLAAVALVLAACGDDDDDTIGQDPPVVGDQADDTLDLDAGDTMTGEMMGVEFTAANGSSVDGTAAVMLDGMQLTVMVDVSGHSPGLPHAQHIHFEPGGEAPVCPTADADADGDGLITTAEGQPAYGGVQVSLTTEGDFGADSALAVDRFPVAEDDGSVTYERTFELDQATVDQLMQMEQVVVALHGIDLDDSGQYDGDAPSSLDPSLPLEATIPAACAEVPLDGMSS